MGQSNTRTKRARATPWALCAATPGRLGLAALLLGAGGLCNAGAAGKLPVSPELAAAAAPRPADSSLYQALGGQMNLVLLVDDFVQRLLRDERMRPFFEEAELPNLKLRLVEQFCVVSGGPCSYGGKDMKTVHEGVDITKADFNALVELLQQSMDTRAIPFHAQNRLLARLAPMHREVINKR
jgi:hemoglobin